MDKVCKNCGILKKESDFYAGRNKCKTCINKRRYQLKKLQKQDPEYIVYYRKQDAKQKRRRRQRGDTKFDFIEGLRGLVRKSIKKKNYTKRSKTFEILGIDKDGFLIHIESQFKDGMTWDNHGHGGWHIDHIIPISSAQSEQEMIKLNHYTNLQPLWAEENLKKGNKL